MRAQKKFKPKQDFESITKKYQQPEELVQSQSSQESLTSGKKKSNPENRSESPSVNEISVVFDDFADFDKPLFSKHSKKSVEQLDSMKVTPLKELDRKKSVKLSCLEQKFYDRKQSARNVSDFENIEPDLRILVINQTIYKEQIKRMIEMFGENKNMKELIEAYGEKMDYYFKKEIELKKEDQNLPQQEKNNALLNIRISECNALINECEREIELMKNAQDTIKQHLDSVDDHRFVRSIKDRFEESLKSKVEQIISKEIIDSKVCQLSKYLEETEYQEQEEYRYQIDIFHKLSEKLEVQKEQLKSQIQSIEKDFGKWFDNSNKINLVSIFTQ